MGRVQVHGLPVCIENVRGSYREGTAPDGTEWRTRLAAHYGYFSGTRGADGDAVDVFIGPFPESDRVWVINQRHVGSQSGFDEHKVMASFHSEDQARDAYTHSFDRGWKGLQSIVPASINQLKWWLKYGNHKVPFLAENLPYDGETMMDKVLWDNNAKPTTTTLGHVMYGLRIHDADAGLLLDAMTVQDLMSDPDIEAVPVYDALVVEVASMQRKMTLLQSTMEAAGVAVKPLEMTIADPVKSRGVLQVMVLFSMSDGQTVSIWFHNPDTTPAKLTPMDELISWKWMINKKDVTIVVAPERGRDLNVREVSRRVMRLVEKNSEAFTKANAKAGERAAATEALKTEIVVLEGTLSGLLRQIEVAKVATEGVDAPALTPPALTDALLHTFIGPDNMQSEVRSRPDGKFGAILRDLDSGSVVGVYIEDTEELAIAKAKVLVGYVEPAAEVIAPVVQAVEPVPTDPVVIVDGAYQFASATDAFKRWIAGSVEDEDYSPFATAKAVDIKAIELGGSISWDVSTAVLDDASEAGEGDDFDATAEWDAVPEAEGEEKVLDGDFKGHPFRGNQFKAAGRASGAAVNASIRAKTAERRGDAESASKAHETAHYAHKAAAVEATGKAKKYHKIMAKFHGTRSGAVLDSVDTQIDSPLFDWMLDDAGESQTAIGVIQKDGEVKGRAHIGGDGKAMVFVGAEGVERIQFPSGRQAMWSDDDADLMLETLLVTPQDRAAIAGPGETDVSRLNAADKLVSKEAIMSDDPQAIEKLDAKLKALLMRQEFMKKTNKLLKKGDDAGLLSMGLSQPQIDKLKLPDFAGRTGFADYLLTNNNGVISSTRKRMDAMIAAAQKEAVVPDPVIETRDPRDVVTDPEGLLIVDPAEPLKAAEVAPVVPAVVEPVEIPAVEEPGEVVDPIKAIDTAYLKTFADGTADMFASDILDRLEPMFAQYENDAAMMELLNQAAQAYSDAAVKAAQAALAG